MFMFMLEVSRYYVMKERGHCPRFPDLLSGQCQSVSGSVYRIISACRPLHDWLCNIVTAICSASPVFSRRPYFYCTRSLGFSHRYIYFFIWPITSWSIMNWGNHLYVPCQYLNSWTFSFANISNVGLNCSVICIIKPWHRCKVWSLSCHQVLVMNHQSLR